MTVLAVVMRSKALVSTICHTKYRRPPLLVKLIVGSHQKKAAILDRMYRQVWHVEQEQILLPRVRWCSSFSSKLRGFTFRSSLDANEGLVLVEKGESRSGTAVHMFFVFCDLAVIWLDANGQIVDTVRAKPWRPAYIPAQPAQYVLETDPDLLPQLQIGHHLQFRAL